MRHLFNIFICTLVCLSYHVARANCTDENQKSIQHIADSIAKRIYHMKKMAAIKYHFKDWHIYDGQQETTLLQNTKKIARSFLLSEDASLLFMQIQMDFAKHILQSLKTEWKKSNTTPPVEKQPIEKLRHQIAISTKHMFTALRDAQDALKNCTKQSIITSLKNSPIQKEFSFSIAPEQYSLIATSLKAFSCSHLTTP